MHRDEPLVGKIGLDDSVAAVAMSHVVGVVRLLHKVATLLQVLDDELAGRYRIKAAVLLGHIGIQRAIRVEQVDRLEAMPPAALPVVGVVGRCDLHHAGSEVLVDEAVGYDGDPPVGERQQELFAHKRSVALVLGVHGDSHIAEHRLGTGRRDRDEAVAVGVGIAHVVELAGHVLVLDLVVREGRAALGAVVDQVLAAVDEATLIEGDEGFAHSTGQALVHREALVVPVA